MAKQKTLKADFLKILLSLLFCAAYSSAAFSQSLPDTTLTPDSLQGSDIGVDTTIYYKAQMIYNDVNNRMSFFYGNAEVAYKNMQLQAGKITLDWDKKLITAEPVPDTTWIQSDSTSDSTMHIKNSGYPVLVDGGDRMTGDMMYYNYDTEKGRVVRGRTELEGGQYKGEQIKRVHSKTYHIHQSSYTTCDLDSNPHFHFEAKRMKMIPDNKVIAKPVVMYLGHIPVAALPFVVFPNKKGRTSGILIPRYGESRAEGRFLRNIGYYWAPNDYFDSKLSLDFFEKTGILLRNTTRYSVRYKLNGSIDGSWTRKNYDGTRQNRWDLRVLHNQTIDPTSSFSVNGYFVSDNSFYKDYSTNLNTRLTRELRSNATYSKRWREQGISMSANLSRTHDLQTGLKSSTIPQLSLRLGRMQPFKSESKHGVPNWYESIYVSYNSNLQNSEREFVTTLASGDDSVAVDRTRRVSHSIGLSMSSPTKFFGWLSLNQSLNIDEDWYDESKNYFYNDATQQIDYETVSGFAARHTFSYSASANTKIYGMFPGIGRVTAFRHVITPSVSYSYQPDFSKTYWGYYDKVQMPDGTFEKRDRFSGTGSNGRSSVSWRMGNLFQMKTGDGKEAKKYDLFNLNLSGGYNFRADRQKMSDVRTMLQASPWSNLSISASSSHSFYVYTSDYNADPVFLFKEGGWRNGRVLRLTDLQFNVRFRLQGKQKAGDAGAGPEQDLPQTYEEMQLREQGGEMNVLEEEAFKRGDRFEPDMDMQSWSVPWRMNVSFNFNLNKRNPENPVKRYYMDISGAEVNLTPNWRLSYSAHYDLEEMAISHHQLTVYRDLHCWEAHIEWVPSGRSRGVYFRINIKAPMLQDIKYDQHFGRRSVLGY